MQDRGDRGTNEATRNSDVVFQGSTWPNELIASLSSILGPFPGIDDERSDQWTTRALIDGLWKNGVPEVLIDLAARSGSHGAQDRARIAGIHRGTQAFRQLPR